MKKNLQTNKGMQIGTAVKKEEKKRLEDLSDMKYDNIV